MIRKPLVLTCALIAVFAAAGCQQKAPEAPPAPAEPAPAAPEAPAPTAPTQPAAGTESAPTAFDPVAFAGTFSGTLPCADCPGIDTRLELLGDGNFKLTETYQERKGDPSVLDGSWTAEEEGKRVRLDPNSKSDQDRLYEIVSNDEIRQLDGEGKAIDSQLPYNLKRQPAQP